ncbi:hypothetical protein [Dactylosporangium sp. CA-092794]|uniref:hypothetical protein n=1 Tax=Dactylosporangium sp. CA-092794 TaxID=3239929 RepID=UPI003D8EE612
MTRPDSAGDGEEAPRDPWRALRRTVSQTVVVFTIPFGFAFGRAALGLSRLKVDRTPAAWTVWGAGVALMLVASVLAVLALRGRAPQRLGKATAWWCAGLWLAGLVLSIVYSEMVPAPSR